MKTPFVLVGDHPDQATGLARILSDLAHRIHRDYPQLDVRTVGYAPWAGIPEQGLERDPIDQVPWTHWVFSDTQKSWGAQALIAAYRSWFGEQEGFLMTVWDPGRCLPYSEVPLPVTRWGYFAIDAENVKGGISGPAAAAVAKYDRVLAYTKFGAKVLASAASRFPATMEIADLPHGLNLCVFRPPSSPADVDRAWKILRAPKGARVIGCVATNHSRKDWGMVAATMRELIDQGYDDLHLWAHTNQMVSEAWSLPQLFDDLGLQGRATITPPLGDQDLARCYGVCAATIAPGRGEGFGYPILESHACGTACVHVDYAGGAEQTLQQYRLAPAYYHLVGPYALRRPIVDPRTCADRLEVILNAPDQEAVRAEARQAAMPLDWESALWPRWRSWINRGLGLGAG